MINPNVKWQKYLSGGEKAINKYLSHYGNPIIEQTFQRLKLAIKSKKSHIILFRFKNSDIVSKIDRKDYILALEKLLSLCTKLEKYEMCREIHNELKIHKLKEARGIKPKARVTLT
jgi:hypothetical protein